MVRIKNTSKTTSYLPSKTGQFPFKPGMNEISQADFDSVKEIQGNKWDFHYSRYLVLVPATVPATVPAEKEKSVKELKETIDGMGEGELILLEDSEKERAEGPRKTVMGMIEKAMTKFDNPDGGDSGDSEGTSDNE